MRCLRAVMPILQEECRRNSTPPRVHRWKAWSADRNSQESKGGSQSALLHFLFLAHIIFILLMWIESPVTVPVAAMWWPSCPFRTSGLSTARTFLSLSVTMTYFAPLETHLFMQSVCPSFAPFAPHIESLTYPFTVWVSAARTSPTIQKRSETASRTNNSFFIASSLSKRHKP